MLLNDKKEQDGSGKTRLYHILNGLDTYKNTARRRIALTLAKYYSDAGSTGKIEPFVDIDMYVLGMESEVLNSNIKREMTWFKKQRLIEIIFVEVLKKYQKSRKPKKNMNQYQKFKEPEKKLVAYVRLPTIKSKDSDDMWFKIAELCLAYQKEKEEQEEAEEKAFIDYQKELEEDKKVAEAEADEVLSQEPDEAQEEVEDIIRNAEADADFEEKSKCNDFNIPGVSDDDILGAEDEIERIIKDAKEDLKEKQENQQ